MVLGRFAISSSSGTLYLLNSFIVIDSSSGHSTLVLWVVRGLRGVFYKANVGIANKFVNGCGKEHHHSYAHGDRALLLTTQGDDERIVRAATRTSFFRDYLKGLVPFNAQGATVRGQRLGVFGHIRQEGGIRTLRGGTCLLVTSVTRLVVHGVVGGLTICMVLAFHKDVGRTGRVRRH